MGLQPVLLNPGPVNLTERVRNALRRADWCHREPEFAELLLDLKRRLLAVYPGAEDEYDALLLTGSGTAAVEALLASLVPTDGRLLVVANGVYGERMAAMAAAHGTDHEIVGADWLAPMDFDAAARRLAEDPGLTHVACVQNETTTGRLNDVAALGRLCREHGRGLLLDAVSAFGAEELRFADWNLVGVAATANKCLHGAPGVSFVVAREDALDAPGPSPSLYLDLRRYRRDQLQGSSPFTMAVHVCFALEEALGELDEAGGVAARRARYAAVAGRIRDGLERLDVEPLIPTGEMSSMISSFRLPDGWTYPELHDALKERGFVIYAGQGELARTIFRIANMGAISDEDVERLLSVLGEVLGG